MQARNNITIKGGIESRRTVNDIFDDWETNPTVNITDDDIAILGDYIDNAWLYPSEINAFSSNFIGALKNKLKFTNQDEFNYVTVRRAHLIDLAIPDLRKLKTLLSCCEDTPYSIKSVITSMANDSEHQLERSDQANFIFDVDCNNAVAVKSALHLAEDKAGLVNTILPESVHKKATSARTALGCAVNRVNMEMLELLLRIPNIDVNIKSSREHSPLEIAAKRGQLEIVIALVQHEADLFKLPDFSYSAAEVDNHYPKEIYDYLLPIYTEKVKAYRDEAENYLTNLGREINLRSPIDEIVDIINRLTAVFFTSYNYVHKPTRIKLRSLAIENLEKRYQLIRDISPYQSSIVDNEISLIEKISKANIFKDGHHISGIPIAAIPLNDHKRTLETYRQSHTRLSKVKDIPSAIKFLTLSPVDIHAASSVIERFLLQPLHDNSDLIKNVTPFLEADGRKRLKKGIMTCIQGVTALYKDSLPSNHWIHTLPALTKDKEGWPILFGLLRLRNDKNVDHDTGTWKTFLNLMKTGNFNKNQPVGVVKSKPMLLMANHDARQSGQGEDGLLPLAAESNQDYAL